MILEDKRLQPIINNRNEIALVQENIPVKLNFYSRFKEGFHNFFRQPTLITAFTFIPSFISGKHKSLALLVNKCHQTFANIPQQNQQVVVFGGDKLNTLQNLEEKLPINDIHKKFHTTLKFSKLTSLDEARVMRKELEAAQQDERIGILNLANRWQPGGVALAPYGGSQEEYLGRRSNLVWGLDPRFTSENVHEQLRQIRLKEGYSDEPFEHHIPYFGAVISKNVTFIDKELAEQFDVISVAAPDMRPGSDEYIHIQKYGKDAKQAQLEILKNKIQAVFDAAISENIQNLVLGAFGCGCFQNDTKEVAQIFSQVLSLEMYQGRFHLITFAITDELKLKDFHTIISSK